jgi:hypothetical protein
MSFPHYPNHMSFINLEGMLKLLKQVFIATEELRGENYATFAEGF